MGDYQLQVTIDQDSGFCFGVVYAIDMAEEILEQDGYLYCLGDIVHNDEEVERLQGDRQNEQVRRELQPENQGCSAVEHQQCHAHQPDGARQFTSRGRRVSNGRQGAIHQQRTQHRARADDPCENVEEADQTNGDIGCVHAGLVPVLPAAGWHAPRSGPRVGGTGAAKSAYDGSAEDLAIWDDT